MDGTLGNKIGFTTCEVASEKDVSESTMLVDDYQHPSCSKLLWDFFYPPGTNTRQRVGNTLYFASGVGCSLAAPIIAGSLSLLGGFQAGYAILVMSLGAGAFGRFAESTGNQQQRLDQNRIG